MSRSLSSSGEDEAPSNFLLVRVSLVALALAGRGTSSMAGKSLQVFLCPNTQYPAGRPLRVLSALGRPGPSGVLDGASQTTASIKKIA